MPSITLLATVLAVQDGALENTQGREVPTLSPVGIPEVTVLGCDAALKQGHTGTQ